MVLFSYHDMTFFSIIVNREKRPGANRCPAGITI